MNRSCRPSLAWRSCLLCVWLCPTRTTDSTRRRGGNSDAIPNRARGSTTSNSQQPAASLDRTTNLRNSNSLELSSNERRRSQDSDESSRRRHIPSFIIHPPGFDRHDTQGSTDIASPSPGGTLALHPSDQSFGRNGEHDLRDNLYSEERECHLRTHDKIVPRSKLEALVTVASVTKDIQARDPDIEYDTALEYARQVCDPVKPAKQLYATLAHVNRGGDIAGLLNEGVCDEHLPLAINASGEIEIQEKDGKPAKIVKSLLGWKKRKVDDFDRCQYIMIAPVFKELGHYEFVKDTILPFLKLDEDIPPGRGGYSRVFPVRIPSDHHNFLINSTSEESDQQELRVAIKQLVSSSEAEFKREAAVLRTLRNRKHPHLIKLLATYKKDEQYHFIFPYANANLRDYWNEVSEPIFDEQTVFWSVRQMIGIVDALQLIHNFTHENPEPNHTINNSSDTKLLIKKGEERYGRHGDIKPENILWFRIDLTYQNAQGILQICDFGHGHFHGRDSRSKIPAHTAVASPTYEPPEIQLQREVSRAYDLWSLGCVILEFITWLVKGGSQIDEFAEARSHPSFIEPGINADNFFTISSDKSGVPQASVNIGVTEWVDSLHEDEKCSQLIHDVLDCVMKDLLVIEPKERLCSKLLLEKLSMFLETAERDLRYAMHPVPVQPKIRAASELSMARLPSIEEQQGRLDSNTNGASNSNENFKTSNSYHPGNPLRRHISTKTWPTER